MVNMQFDLSTMDMRVLTDAPEAEVVSEHHETGSHRETVEGSTNSPEILTELQDDDVLLGRGRSHAKRPANIRFHGIIAKNRQLYFDAESQKHKKVISEDIMNQIGGRFLRRSTTQNGWVEIPRELARVKVAQALQYRQRVEENNYVDATGSKFSAAKKKNKAIAKNGISNLSGGTSKSFMHDLTSALNQYMDAACNDDSLWQPLALDEEPHPVDFISDTEIYWALNVDPVQLRYHNEALERGCANIVSDETAIGMPYNEYPVSNHFHDVPSSVVVPKGSLVTPTPSMDFQHAGQYAARQECWQNESMWSPEPHHIRSHNSASY